MAEDGELRGHVIGANYRLVRRVEDGVPVLYEAQHPRVSGRFVAQLWPPTIPWDAFRAGAEVAATLRHPGVVQVLDFNCEPGAPPFLITEWPAGFRLSALIGSTGPFPLKRTIALVESTAWTLASAHLQGVVHQELHPADIWVVEGVGTPREWTKLDGLGIAAALARAEVIPPSPYRAPEQASPEDDAADPQSDQYALAAIAREMLTGARPTTSALDDGALPPAVAVVLGRALSTEPEQRFAGIMEFARALREAAEGGNTQVVRRRKLEPRNAVRAPETEEVRSPAVTPARLVAPLAALLGKPWRAARARVAGVVPRGAPARAGIALGLLLAAFGVFALALRRPPGPRIGPAVTTARAQALAAPQAVRPTVVPAPAPTPAPPAGATLASTAPKDDTAPPAGAEAAPHEGDRALPVAAVKVATGSEPGAAEAPEAADSAEPSENAADQAPSEAEPARKRRPVRRAPLVKPPSLAAAPKLRTAPRAAPAPAVGRPFDSCVISIGSKPAADVWLDERKLNRRTPLVGYRVGCGDHKVVLKREDLDLYQMEMITVRAGAPFKKSYPLQ